MNLRFIIFSSCLISLAIGGLHSAGFDARGTRLILPVQANMPEAAARVPETESRKTSGSVEGRAEVTEKVPTPDNQNAQVSVSNPMVERRLEPEAEQKEEKREKSRSELFYNLARNYLVGGDPKKYAEYLELSANAGNDEFALKARAELRKLQAAGGDISMIVRESRESGQDRKFLADGYEACHHRDSSRQDCLNKMEDHTAILSESSYSNEEIQNRLRVAAHANTRGEYDKAIAMLLPVAEKADVQSNPAMGQVWLLIGEALERSGEFRDLYRARRAYNRALAFDETRSTAGYRLRSLDSQLSGFFMQ